MLGTGGQEKMDDFIIALFMVIGFLVVFIPIGLLLYRYGFWVYDKIDDAFEKMKEKRDRNG